MNISHVKIPGQPVPLDCPMRAALSAIGGKWSLILLHWLYERPRRFGELQRLVPDISHKVLTEALRNLEQEGLIAREIHEKPVVYAISAHGRSVRHLIDAIHDWGQRHLEQRRGDLV
ncbi:MAG: helix-turn-helix domain-containing protein [Steroidobacteraceae bacterium]